MADEPGTADPKAGREEAIGPATPVELLMRTEFPICEYDDPVAKAARLILENDLPALPVVRAGKAVGVIAARDLLALAYSEMLASDRDFLLTPIDRLIADRKFTAARRQTEVLAALQIARREKRELIVVVEDGRAVGVLDGRELSRRMLERK